MPTNNNTKTLDKDTKTAILQGGAVIKALVKARDEIAGAMRCKLITMLDIDGNPNFSFYVRGLNEGEYDDCRTEATHPITGKIDQARERSAQIYKATLDEYKYIWDSDEILEKFGTKLPTDVIKDVILPGDKIAICSEIDRLSGFDPERRGFTVIDEIKN